jgi:hypothetical protein
VEYLGSLFWGVVDGYLRVDEPTGARWNADAFVDGQKDTPLLTKDEGREDLVFAGHSIGVLLLERPLTD